MQQLTDEGRRIVDDVARRHGFSSDAVPAMLLAVSAGYGNQAQFSHPEFGGMGQWSMGGMTMIGDMFNNHLKGRVASLCQELYSLIQGQPLFAVPAQSQSQRAAVAAAGKAKRRQLSAAGQRAAASARAFSCPRQHRAIGGPRSRHGRSTGAQNNLSYAWFPAMRRLAVDVNGQVTVYDTGENQIGGFSQQQGGDQSMTFTSQFGLVRVGRSAADQPHEHGCCPTAALPRNKHHASQPDPWVQGPRRARQRRCPRRHRPPRVPWRVRHRTNSGAPQAQHDEIVSLIEKLAELHKKSILTDSEYEAKKSELLSRL